MDRHMQIVQKMMCDETPVDVNLTTMQVWVLISAIQLMTWHPGISDRMKRLIEDIARQFQDNLIERHPDANALLEMGWEQKFDVDTDGNPVNPVTHVRQVWTVYRLNEDGTTSEQPFAELSRPQDWGMPGRWKYRVYALEARVEGVDYRNEVHCWAEMPISDAQHLDLFDIVTARILTPSRPLELCGNTHLAPDDFWCQDWGKLPPVYDPSDGDW